MYSNLLSSRVSRPPSKKCIDFWHDQACIHTEEFESWRKSFVDKHIDVFTFDDENKLEYTDIHREYEAKIEEFIVASLPSSLDVSVFMAELPAFMEGVSPGTEPGTEQGSVPRIFFFVWICVM